FQGKLASGQDVRVTIGDVRVWTIDKARQEARRLQALIDQKIDPRQARAEEIAAAEARLAEQQAKEAADKAETQRQALLVGDAWGTYLAHQKDKMSRSHIERGKKWGDRHLSDHLNLSQPGSEPKKRGKGLTKPGVLFPLMSWRLADVTADKLKEWQRQEAETRANNARQGFEMFRAFWRWCAGRPEYAKVIDADAVEGKELRDEVPGRKAKGEDCLQREQLAPWFREVRNLFPVQSAYLQVTLLTGRRREEIAPLRWDDVDFKWRSLHIKDKVDGESTIPLPPYLTSILLDLKRRNETPPPPTRILAGKRIANNPENWMPSPWVFSSPTAASGRIEEPREAHNRALAAAGLPHLSIHGLRRSFGTLAEWVECPAGVVAQIQGHKPSGTRERHYIRRPLDLLRMWHTRIEAWMLEQAGIEQPKEEAKPAMRVATAT
ncbi:MAG TPA: tyrosine-type recombinase/integrase, partial [Rhodocyclaceae bacterium]|nr:tyrosine-type recombinase/integrase [Rhodocyclaceae bacterium]